MNNIDFYNSIFWIILESIRKDSEYNFHIACRTAMISYKLAESYNLESSHEIFYAGLLHNVGNIGKGQEEIRSQYSYDPDNIEKSREHIYIASELAERIVGLEDISKIIDTHHEFINGSGYPRNLNLDDLNLQSIILSFAAYIDHLLDESNGNIDHVTITINQNKNILYPEYLVTSFTELFLMDLENVKMLYDFDSIFANLEQIIQKINGEPRLVKVINADFEQIKEIFAYTLLDLFQVKHNKFMNHSNRVAFYCSVFTEHLNLPKQDRDDIFYAALLHDVGLIGVSKTIYKKFVNAEPMTNDELLQYHKHIDYYIEFVESLNLSKEIIEIGKYHHKYSDNSGFPEDLDSCNKPFLGKILTICNDFDYFSHIFKDKVITYDDIFQIMKNKKNKYDDELLFKAQEILRDFVF